MEDAYEDLRKQGKNTVDNLVQWLQDAKVIEKEKGAEDKALKLFEEVKDKTNVELEYFKEAVSKLAVEQKKSNDELTRLLTEQAPKFLEALIGAAAAVFQEFLNKEQYKE